MTQDLIVWGLLAGSAGLVSILAYGIWSDHRPDRRDKQDGDDSTTHNTDPVSTPPHRRSTL